MISIITLIIVFVLIAVRRVGIFRFQIWQVMLGGAVVVLVTGQISPSGALKAINPDVLLFLFGMFIVGQAMDESGYLAHLSYRLFGRARSVNGLLFLIMFGAGILSAIMLNDTLAIIGTPVMLQLSRKTGIKPKILLISLMFSITIGSVLSPIGNPQNLLVAVNGNIASPFVTFLKYLGIPTLVNLLITCFIIKLFYRQSFDNRLIEQSPELIQDPKLASLSRIALFIILAMIVLKIAAVFIGPNIDFRLTYVALAGALPIIALSPRRLHILYKIDWLTLVFFASMFVLMESVWDTGYFQSAIADAGVNLVSTGMIMAVSVVLSQFISNVPLVALYLPVLENLGATTEGLMALAAGSTIAGNLSILGAASNVIIIQNAEKKAGETITFLELIRIGIPVTVINIVVYWVYFLIF